MIAGTVLENALQELIAQKRALDAQSAALDKPIGVLRELLNGSLGSREGPDESSEYHAAARGGAAEKSRWRSSEESAARLEAPLSLRRSVAVHWWVEYRPWPADSYRPSASRRDAPEKSSRAGSAKERVRAR